MNELVSIILDDNLAYCDPFNENSTEYLKLKKSFETLIYQLHLDKDKFGNANWNPFSDFIKKGDNVVIKPNFVRHIHVTGGGIFSVIVHPIIIKLVLEYVYKALGKSGTVIIGDASLQSADFDRIVEITKLKELKKIYNKKGFDLTIKDFRRESSIKDPKNLSLNWGRKEINPIDEFIEVDLKTNSYFNEVSDKFKSYRVTDYDVRKMKHAHNQKNNKYLIHKDILNADVIISIPKLKTHRKAGFTCAMKNNIGINGQKDFLPHHRCGSIAEGGDEYQYKNFINRIQTELTEYKYLISYKKGNVKKVIRQQKLINTIKKSIGIFSRLFGKKNYYKEGSWYGNDTIWRTIADLNNIIYNCNKSGILKDKQQRTVFTINDGIICGDKEGPMGPRKRPIGLLSASFSTYNHDLFMTRIMGFDWERIPFLKKTINKKDLTDIQAIINGKNVTYADMGDKYNFQFIPTQGWKGYIEK